MVSGVAEQTHLFPALANWGRLSPDMAFSSFAVCMHSGKPPPCGVAEWIYVQLSPAWLIGDNVTQKLTISPQEPLSNSTEPLLDTVLLMRSIQRAEVAGLFDGLIPKLAI